VLFVGRLQARKRLDALLHICAKLPQDLQPQVVIVGDGPERRTLEKLADNVYPSTEFRGSLFGRELDKAFNQADLFVLPGTGGLAVQEAMAHALPVIVAQGDGSQGDLVTPENGWLLPPGDDEALRSALVGALRDAKRLRQMGAASFRKVQETFNLENMVACFIEALSEASG
jgi:glycosyltransferase involved in cell wall biosynthesis